MRKKLLTAVLLVAAIFNVSACNNASKNENSAKNEAKKEVSVKQEKENKTSEKEAIELIYAKTPEEAAEKCLEAIYSGNLDDAKHYVDSDGKAFEALDDFKSGIMKAYKAEKDDERRALVEEYISNFFSKFSYTEKSKKQKGDSATLVYSVSMPDAGGIKYSSYMDSYMTANGISPETLITELEGMSSEESADWSLEFELEVMNYVYGGETDIPMTNIETTVKTEKGKEGWIVTEIINLAG